MFLWNMDTVFTDGEKCAVPAKKPVRIFIRENTHNSRQKPELSLRLLIRLSKNLWCGSTYRFSRGEAVKKLPKAIS